MSQKLFQKKVSFMLEWGESKMSTVPNNNNPLDKTKTLSDLILTTLSQSHRRLPVGSPEEGMPCMTPDHLGTKVATTFFSSKDPMDKESYDAALVHLLDKGKVRIDQYPTATMFPQKEGYVGHPQKHYPVVVLN